MIAETGWDCLLNLDGVTMVIDERLGFWVKFVAREMPKTDVVPHGVNYSLASRSGPRLCVRVAGKAAGGFLAGSGSGVEGVE